MTIPTASNFPDSLDDNENLFWVHDALRLRLFEDYAAGDSTIQAEGDPFIAALMPPTGIITLTEQCSDLDKRALSFHYGSFDSNSLVFSDLDLLENFEDVPKPKRITNITMNVMERHHNHIKNALIKIQEFCGIEGTLDTQPFGDTLEGRINFLRKLVLVPRAWFTSDLRTGNVPLEIEFKDMSFRLGTDGNAGDVTFTWDFGDQTTSMISMYSLISATDEVLDASPNVLVRDMDGGTIKKTYHQPGIYDVKLTVANDFGSDICIFPDFVNARVKAPNDAVIRFIANTPNQSPTPGVPPDGPFDIPPKIRSPINTLVEMNVPEGENPSQPGYSYGGEILDESDQPIDPIIAYTWALGDDLTHPNSRETKGSWSVGGIYDMKLRVDTEYGAFRITTYEDSIDIVENQNLWLWTFQTSTKVRSYEYGLISETFKLSSAPTLTVNQNDDFIDGQPSLGQEQQRREFLRNTGFAPRGTGNSGQGGGVMLYWASGRNQADPVTSETINVVEYNGFTGLYSTPSIPTVYRQWNWANLNSSVASYFVFGGVASYAPNSSPTNITKQTMEFNTLSVSSEDLVADNYLNGANELEQNAVLYEDDGSATNGHFSVYRTTWKDSNGYIARNDSAGTFFRIKSFYRTEGTIGSPFINIRKLQDIQGPTKLEGQLVDLSTGVFLLNNSGSVSRFDTEATVWSTGGPGINSLLYRSLQDTDVSGFDDQENTLLASSDSDKRAYLSFDYSPNAFLKFSEIDLTFSSLGSRPEGNQLVMGVY
jgi:PKD repeat protein